MCTYKVMSFVRNVKVEPWDAIEPLLSETRVFHFTLLFQTEFIQLPALDSFTSFVWPLNSSRRELWLRIKFLFHSGLRMVILFNRRNYFSILDRF